MEDEESVPSERSESRDIRVEGYELVVKKAMSQYFTYLARCSDNSLYTGYTVNIKDRESKHNKGDGAKYTKYRRPVKIVYWEKFETINEAMQREAQIKRWSKAKKEKLISI